MGVFICDVLCEIFKHSPTGYVFHKDGAQWVIHNTVAWGVALHHKAWTVCWVNWDVFRDDILQGSKVLTGYSHEEVGLVVSAGTKLLVSFCITIMEC